jgi:hypothetical protein
MIQGGQRRRAGWRDDSHDDCHNERRTDGHWVLFYPAMGTPSGTLTGVKGCAMVGTSSGTLTGTVNYTVGCTMTGVVSYSNDWRGRLHSELHTDWHGRLHTDWGGHWRNAIQCRIGLVTHDHSCRPPRRFASRGLSSKRTVSRHYPKQVTKPDKKQSVAKLMTFATGPTRVKFRHLSCRENQSRKSKLLRYVLQQGVLVFS